MSTDHTTAADQPPLAWARRDIEQRMLFRGGRHTRVNNALASLLATLATVVLYAVLVGVFPSAWITRSLTGNQNVPYAIVFFSFWAIAILALKWKKISLQEKALRYEVTPADTSFVLSAANVDHVIDQMYRIVDEPKHFILYNRISVALANLRNLGRIGDVDEILRSQADNDEAASDTSYNVLNGFVWAIPVLGFIGTVLGLSGSLGEFMGVLESTDDVGGIKEGLGGVMTNLSTAFETTLQALIAALFIQLSLTFVKKREQEFLDECGRYCTEKVVNKLRIMPFERVSKS